MNRLIRAMLLLAAFVMHPNITYVYATSPTVKAEGKFAVDKGISYETPLVDSGKMTHQQAFEHHMDKKKKLLKSTKGVSGFFMSETKKNKILRKANEEQTNANEYVPGMKKELKVP